MKTTYQPTQQDFDEEYYEFQRMLQEDQEQEQEPSHHETDDSESEMWDEDYVPDYYDDTDDEEEDTVEEDKKISYEVRMRQLNDLYKRPLEECNKILVDKNLLNWTQFESPIVAFPKETEAPRPKKAAKKTEEPAVFRPSNIPVKVTDDGVSYISWKLPKTCNYILKGQQCPFGVECMYQHVLKRALCRNMDKCTNKKCTFTHPPKPKKSFMCKNIKETGKCRFGVNCQFAHSKEEVKKNTDICRFGKGCKNIKVDANGTFTNSGDRKCIRIHQGEGIENFISRM